MYFDESFFEEEIREGFRIRPMVKKAWAAQLEVLEEVNRICKKYNIMYYAEWGTLLGAVRHHGFIPWDDDFDIGMRRKDYWKFLEVAKDEIKPPFEVHNVRTTPSFKEVMTRVTNGHSITTEPSFMERFHGCPYVCGIDVFPNDNIPDNEEEQKIYGNLFGGANYLGYYWDTEELTKHQQMKMLDTLQKAAGKKVRRENGMTMSQSILNFCEQIASMYYDVDTKFVGQVDLFSKNGYKLPVELFSDTIDMPFENTTIPVAIGYDRILRKKYGDNYMTPVYRGGSHDYPFFKEYENTLYKGMLDMYGEIPVQFRD